MRGLIWLVVLAAAAWSGYWVIGSRALEKGANDWFAAQAEAGLLARNAGLDVQGFPNRFDLTVTEPEFYDPASGFGWRGPFLQLFSLSYQPWKVIAAFPPEQVLIIPGGDLTVDSEKLQASAVLAQSSPFGVDRIVLVGDGLAVASSLGWRVAAKTFRFATKSLSDDGLEHEIGLEALAIDPGPALLAALPDLPPVIEKMRLDAVVGLSGSSSAATVTGVDVKEILLLWGDVALYGKGRVAANADGLAEGRIEFRLTNWRALLPLAVASGAVTAESLPTWERALSMLAAQSGDGSDLDLPLTMQNGRMSLGPVPIGPAPRIN
jgi:hypothetical protein